jgi:hypothetical protein
MLTVSLLLYGDRMVILEFEDWRVRLFSVTAMFYSESSGTVDGLSAAGGPVVLSRHGSSRRDPPPGIFLQKDFSKRTMLWISFLANR